MRWDSEEHDTNPRMKTNDTNKKRTSLEILLYWCHSRSFVIRVEKTMLIGEYTHTLDPKKRLSFPAKFRKEMGKKVVITRGLDACLFVYPMKEWERIARKIAELPLGQSDSRGFNRFLLAGAVESEVDGAGRVLIPDFLKTFADLKEKVIVAGMHTRVEIWDEGAWSAYKKRIEANADTLAEKLGDLGIL